MDKRFKLHIKWSNLTKTEGIAELSDNGQPLLKTECIEDARLLQTILNELHEENEQLKQRNNRQAKRLAELYELMAKKDWESLTEIIDDFCSCEEQLQRESGTYSDWND